MYKIKYWIRKWSAYRFFHLIFLRIRTYFVLPKWNFILKSIHKINNNLNITLNESKRILFATGTAGHLPSITLESFLAIAFLSRGFKSDFLLCDKSLSACMMCEVNWYSDLDKFAKFGPIDRCNLCFNPSSKMLHDLGFQQLGLNSYITDEERLNSHIFTLELSINQIKNFCIGGVPVGEHAMAGALRFFSRGNLDHQLNAIEILRKYLESALLTYYACHRILSSGAYNVVVLNHGIYVPQGVIAETARLLGVRVVTWHTAYRKGSFIFNHDETYHHGLMTEPCSSWETMEWTSNHKLQIENYLKSRWIGSNDWVKFHNNPEFDIDIIKNEIGIDFSIPTVGLLTNVVWDAQLHYKANAFPNMQDWLIKTIKYFELRPHLQLIIRVHPAELTGTIPTKQPVIDEIKFFYNSLPKNVFIIPPESRISTYSVISNCDSVIIYGTKMGVELSALGIPVIVAGEAWVRGKGITYDAESESDYYCLLDKLPLNSSLTSEVQLRALKYAYHFFFRRMIPLEFIKMKTGSPNFKVSIDQINDLSSGKSKGLDIICNGIVNGSPFIYPAENELNVL
jgi:hypothetical protein